MSFQTEIEIPKKPVVLILDDDELCQAQLKLVCLQANANIHPVSAKNPEAAKQVLQDQFVHVLILDRDLGRDSEGSLINGIDFISDFLAIQPYLQIVVVTGSREVDDVVRAMKSGAINYILKDDSSFRRFSRAKEN